MKITKNFTLEEFTATSYPCSNMITDAAIENVRALCVNVLQPLRDIVGPITVTSGYRSRELNAMVGGSATSQHLSGMAADIKCGDMAAAFDVLRRRFRFDQLIWEYGDDCCPAWIHVSYGPRLRGEVLRVRKGRTERLFSR